MEELKLLVLMSTHNRQQQLAACLVALRKSISSSNLLVSLANSGDIVEIPDNLGIKVIVTEVPSNTFWAEAMHKASTIFTNDPTFSHVLWLNDDVTLFPNSIDDLIQLMLTSKADIVVGQTSSDDGEITYGGYRRMSALMPLHFHRVMAQAHPLNIDTFNGNIVLLGSKVLSRLGCFLPGYKHYLADIAFGLEANNKGLKVIAAPGFSGSCKANNAVNPSLDKSISRMRRLSNLNQPQGIPFAQQLKFTTRYGRTLSVVYFLATYMRFVITLLTYRKSHDDSNF